MAAGIIPDPVPFPLAFLVIAIIPLVAVAAVKGIKTNPGPAVPSFRKVNVSPGFFCHFHQRLPFRALLQLIQRGGIVCFYGLPCSFHRFVVSFHFFCLPVQLLCCRQQFFIFRRLLQCLFHGLLRFGIFIAFHIGFRLCLVLFCSLFLLFCRTTAACQANRQYQCGHHPCCHKFCVFPHTSSSNCFNAAWHSYSFPFFCPPVFLLLRILAAYCFMLFNNVMISSFKSRAISFSRRLAEWEVSTFPRHFEAMSYFLKWNDIQASR